jgi:catechol 2,3-dioxygenase-like lactoylglutathione lyase family enzyme
MADQFDFPGRSDRVMAREGGEMDMLLEVVQVPVGDVDRARDFYADRVGFTVDHDTQISDEVRVVQLTPPGSGCSIVVGTGMTTMEPGSVQGLQLTVRDMDGTRDGLVERGVEVSDVEVLGREGHPGFKHAYFSDPDGNAWVLQELPLA